MKEFMFRNLSKISLILLLIFVLSPLCGSTPVTILYTNDTHSNLMPLGNSSYGKDFGGLARRAHLVREIRKASPGALLLDGGDMFQGTPFYSLFKGEACYKSAVAAGYDATTIGNHELDNGLANLQEQVDISGIRLLCCNVFFKDTRKTVFPAYHVFSRNGLRIAVIGSLGQSTWRDIDRKILAALSYGDQIKEVQKVARRLRKYVDLIVVLSHGGFDDDKKMAAQISEIDIIVGGHTHTSLLEPLLVLNEPDSGAYDNGLNGTIVLQSGDKGAQLGRIDMLIDKKGRITTYSGRLIKVTNDHEPPVDDPVKKLVDGYYKKLDSIMSEIVGYTAKPLSMTSDLKKTYIFPMGTFTAQSILEIAKSDISIVNSGAIRDEVAAGSIVRGNIYSAIPYDNTIVTFKMTGEAVQNMLNLICSYFGELDGYQIAGISAEFDFKNKSARNVKIAGKPIVKKQTYLVSTTSFIANGNLGGDKLFSDIETVEDSGIFMRDAALSYLEKVKEVPDFSVSSITIVQ